MKCILMNKYKEVLSFELEENNNITQIYEIFNIEYAPLCVENASKDKSKSIVKELNHWFTNRGIPSWRKNLTILLENLNVTSSSELLDKSYGLSLSDQYWFKEEQDNKITWDNINFFTNDFEYEAYLNASLSNSTDKSFDVSLKSPNNTTDGMLQKAWIIKNKNRYLVKGTYARMATEPINEWLASEIARRLNFDYCPYEIDIYKGKLVSMCKDFINEDEELIPAWQIFESEKKNNNDSDFTHYIKLLEKHGLKDAEKKVTDMFLIDYLIGNFDRHMNNFGVIRNVNTLEWKKLAPIFDSGEAMCCNSSLYEINLNNVIGKCFTNTSKNLNELYEDLNLKNYDLTPLKGLDQEYKEKLIEFNAYTLLSDEVMSKLTTNLKNRIEN